MLTKVASLRATMMTASILREKKAMELSTLKCLVRKPCRVAEVTAASPCTPMRKKTMQTSTVSLTIARIANLKTGSRSASSGVVPCAGVRKEQLLPAAQTYCKSLPLATITR